MAVILVTGGAGTLGKALVAELRGAGHEVIAAGRIAGPHVEAQWDLATEDAPSGSPKPEIVVHAAAKVGRFLAPLEEALPLHEVNATGTLRVARWCASVGAKRLVAVSGALVYGSWDQPRTEADQPRPWLAGAYAVSKWLGEQAARLVEREGCSLAVLRLSSLWGADYTNGLPQKMIRQAKASGRLKISPPFDDAFDFLHVRDAARVVARASLATESGVWNAGGGGTITLRALAGACARAANVALVETAAPAARPGRVLNWVDDRKARRELGHTNTIALDPELELVARRLA